MTVFSGESITGEIETGRLFFAGQPLPNWINDHPDVMGAVFVDQARHVQVVGLKPDQVRIIDHSYDVQFIND